MISINLGPGRKPHQDIGIDRFPLPGVSLVADLERGLKFLRDNSVDRVVCEHFLEHIENFEPLMEEIFRVCKPSAVIEIAVPHFSNPHYYSDFTHRRFFGLYTFDYFTPRELQPLKRKVPDYYSTVRFQVERREFGFASRVKFRRMLKSWVQRYVNSNRGRQEFYEESLCWLIPCHEIRFFLKPLKDAVA
jgi:ubiquinone/menaquinone biosynthesis C-methylase UbiE